MLRFLQHVDQYIYSTAVKQMFTTTVRRAGQASLHATCMEHLQNYHLLPFGMPVDFARRKLPRTTAYPKAVLV